MKNIYPKPANTFACFLLAAVILSVIVFISSPDAAVRRLAVIPFQINADKDLTYLQNGIVDMLSSRLAQEETLMVISRGETAKAAAAVAGPINAQKAHAIATSLGADYVIFGSLTLFGQNISLDAQMVDITGDKKPIRFFRQGQGIDSIIPGIDAFATQINEEVFGRKTAVTQSRPNAESQPQVFDSRTHPEKLFSSGVMDEETGRQGGMSGAPNEAFIVGSRRQSSQNFWKSKNFGQLITGIAVGDTDQDGQKETVVVSDQSVDIYRFVQRRFIHVAQIYKTTHDHFISVDVADINANGIPEIFVSALNAQQNLTNSFVLEFDGKDYKPIVTKSRWYYRVMNTRAIPVLFGQKQASQQYPFSKQLYELNWQGGEYAASRSIRLKTPVNLIGFAAGDIANDQGEIFVGYTDFDRLFIAKPNGDEVWKSENYYGGSSTVFLLAPDQIGQIKNIKYLPVRLLLVDLDHDGTLEIITAVNKELGNNRLQTFRHFTSGWIESLTWDQMGMNTNWKTRKMAGRISDFAVGDFDNDGQPELIIVSVLKEGDIIGTQPKSTISAYDLKQ